MTSISQRIPTSRRRILAGLTVPIAAVALAACGTSSARQSGTAPAPGTVSSSAGSSPARGATSAGSTAAVSAVSNATQAPKSGQVAVQFMSWGDETRQKVRSALTAKFNAAHPGIVASWTVIPSSNYSTKLLTMIAGNVAPDIYMLAPTDLIEYAIKGIALDLSPLIARDHYDTSDYPPKSLQQLQFENKQYAFPQDFPTRGIFYNKTLFQQAGVPLPPGNYTDPSWTWQRFLDAAQKLTKPGANGGPGTFGYSTGYVERQWAPWVYTNGGEWLNADLTVCTMTDAACVDGLQFLQDLSYKYKVATGPDVQQEEGYLPMFASGKVAMIEAIPGNIDQVQQQVKGFDWDCTHIPKGAGGYACTGGGSAYAAYARTAHPDQTWQFFQFSESPQAQKAHVDVGATFPSRYSVYAYYYKQNAGKPPAHLKMFVDAQSALRLDPQTDNWAQIDTAITKEMDLLSTNKNSAKEVAQKIKAAVDPLLKAATARKPRS